MRLAVTGAVAVASYHLIEKPIRNRRLLPGRPWLPLAAGVSLALVVDLLVLTTVPPRPLAAPKAPKKVGVFAVPAALPDGVTRGHPVRILLLGDSLAYTLGGGLGVEAGAWGASLDNEGHPGLRPRSPTAS